MEGDQLYQEFLKSKKKLITDSDVLAANERFEKGTTVKDALDFMTGKREKPKEKVVGEEQQGRKP